jgi:hypothetical protein
MRLLQFSLENCRVQIVREIFMQLKLLPSLLSVFGASFLFAVGCSQQLETNNSSEENGQSEVQATAKDPLAPRNSVAEKIEESKRLASGTHFRCEMEIDSNFARPYLNKIDVPNGAYSQSVTAAFTWDKLGSQLWNQTYTSTESSTCVAGTRRQFTIVECKFNTGSFKKVSHRIEISLDETLVTQAFVRKVKFNQGVWHVGEKSYSMRCWAQ